MCVICIQNRENFWKEKFNPKELKEVFFFFFVVVIFIYI